MTDIVERLRTVADRGSANDNAAQQFMDELLKEAADTIESLRYVADNLKAVAGE